MLIKICGITNTEDALAAVEFGADALGFNFYPKSPRYVAPETVLQILEEIPPSILRVGVFVNERDSLVRDLSVDLNLGALQFHGDEVPTYCEQFATPYWKAFRLKDAKTVELMKRYRPQHFVLDAFVEDAFGGTGILADWDLAREAKKAGSVLLAGGLKPDNVEAAILAVRPAGVDVASGVESSPGRKDHAKLERFIENALSAAVV